jgi:hypothetical protein
MQYVHTEMSRYFPGRLVQPQLCDMDSAESITSDVDPFPSQFESAASRSELTFGINGNPAGRGSLAL